jgi:hypothetical protein
MIYGNNVDANFEYLQRRMVEKALDALQAKHDELAELVRASLLYEDANDEMCYLEGGESYLDLGPPKARRNFIRDWECIDKALHKAVEEK